MGGDSEADVGGMEEKRNAGLKTRAANEGTKRHWVAGIEEETNAGLKTKRQSEPGAKNSAKENAKSRHRMQGQRKKKETRG